MWVTHEYAGLRRNSCRRGRLQAARPGVPAPVMPEQPPATGGLQRPPEAATLLAFDYGARRIGVAVGNTLLRAALPVGTIEQHRKDDRFAAIGALIAQWQPAKLVVGLPVHADGSEHALTARVRRFARQLGGRFGLPVEWVDERYTTVEAKARLAGRGGGRRQRSRQDAVAAQVILQAYFDEAPAVA